MNYLEWYIDLNVAFVIRMLVIFTIMMKYKSWRGEKNFTLAEKIPYGIFTIIDVIYNWTVTLPFWDKPANWKETISLRCTRYVKAGMTNNPITWFRYGFAKVIQFVTEFSDKGHI